MAKFTKADVGRFKQDAVRQFSADEAKAFYMILNNVVNVNDHTFRVILKTLIAKRVVEATIANVGEKFSTNTERYCRKLEFVIDAIAMTENHW